MGAIDEALRRAPALLTPCPQSQWMLAHRAGDSHKSLARIRPCWQARDVLFASRYSYVLVDIEVC
jgi:hypothetical protein